MREETERDSLFEALGFFKGEGKGEKGIEVERRKKSPTLKKLLPETKTKNIKTRDKPVAWGCSGPQQMWKSGIAYGNQPEAPPLCGPPAAVAPPAEEFRDCPGCFRQNWAGRVVTLSVDSWKMGSGGERERERERESFLVVDGGGGMAATGQEKEQEKERRENGVQRKEGESALELTRAPLRFKKIEKTTQNKATMVPPISPHPRPARAPAPAAL